MSSHKTTQDVGNGKFVTTHHVKCRTTFHARTKKWIEFQTLISISVGIQLAKPHPRDWRLGEKPDFDINEPSRRNTVFLKPSLNMTWTWSYFIGWKGQKALWHQASISTCAVAGWGGSSGKGYKASDVLSFPQCLSVMAYRIESWLPILIHFLSLSENKAFFGARS